MALRYHPRCSSVHSSGSSQYGKFPHNADGKSSPKSNDPFANEAKGSETQVKGEIDEQSEKRQVWTCQPSEK